MKFCSECGIAIAGETLEEGAVRETFEGTGVRIDRLESGHRFQVARICDRSDCADYDRQELAAGVELMAFNQSAFIPRIVGIGGTARPNSTSERAIACVLRSAENLGATTRLF